MSLPVNDEMNEFWNGETGRKWVRYQERLDAHLAPMGALALEAARPRSGERVLDIGCGCGDTTFALARAVAPKGRVVGVDLSAPMLARARERAAQSSGAFPTGAVSFLHADAQTHAFEPASFDLLFSRFGVMFFEDPVAAFTHLQAALVPGGRLAFVCWQAAARNPWVQIPLQVVAQHIPLPPPPEPGAPGQFAFGEADYVERILGQAGFADVTLIAGHPDMTVGHGVDDAVDFLMTMGMPARAIAFAEADDATRARIARELRQALASYDQGPGSDHAIVLGTAIWSVTATRP